MPILVSSTYVHGYGKSGGVVTLETSLNSMDSSLDVFLVKYDTMGKALWSARIASTGSETGYGITTDSSGNIYLTGQGGSAAVVTAYNSDGTAFGTTFANAGNNDVFIAKYNTSGNVQWVARIASTAQDIGYGIATDSSGNVYLTGQGGSAAVVTAYNSNGVAFGTTIPSAGSNDVFIVKYNTSGTVQWVARIASTATDTGFAIASDSSGNIYLTGQGGSAAVVTAYNSDGTAFATTIPNAGSNDAFIVKYNTSGFVQWVARIASTASDRGNAITTDSSGNVYVTGQGGSAVVVTAYNSDGTAFGTTLPNTGSSDAFIVKYNTSGFVQWVTRLSSNTSDTAYAIATDSGGNVYVAGPTPGTGATVTAYNSDGTAFGTTIPSAGNSEAFIVKYNTSGFVQWVTRISSSSVDIGYGIATDSSGNVYITGQGGSDVVVTAYNSNGTPFGTTLPNAGGGDAFIVKYNTSGTVQWVTRIASNTDDTGRCVAVDSNSNVYVAGEFSGVRCSIYGQALSLFTTIPNAGVEDGFIVKYNTNGSPQWAARIASTGTDIVYGVAMDSGGNIYVTGYGGSGVVVTAYNSDGTAFGTTLANAGSNDAFIVKYNTSGFVQWVARIASTSQDIGYGIATDSSGNVYITGRGGTSVVTTVYNSDGTAFGTTLPNAGGIDGFVVKYNTSGFVQWVARIASTLTDRGYGITTDSSNNVYVTGETAGVLTAYNSNGTAFGTTIPNAGGTDVFTVKYNTSGTVQWIARIASTASDTGFAIASDSSGNIYLTGQGGSAAVVTAYNSDGTAFGTTLPNAGSNDAFIVKYNTSGNVQWVARIASTAQEIGYGIATDSSSNVYVTGLCGAGTTVTLYNSDGTAFPLTLPNSSLADVFIVKYNTAGFVQWGARVASSSSDIGYGIATDSGGNVYVVTSNATSVASLSIYNSNTQIFASLIGSCAVVKYNTNGFAQWAQAIRGTTVGVDTRAVATDSLGNVVIGSTALDGQVVSVYNANSTPYKIINAIGFQGAFVVKYSSTTTPLWVARIESTGSDTGFAIATDSGGNVYVTGEGGIGVVVTAYNSDGTAFGTTLPNRVGGDAFVVKYDTNGTVQWVAQIASNAQDRGYGIATDSGGNVYITGEGGAGTVTAYNSNGTAFGTTLPTSGGDAFVVKYDTNGTVQWAARIASAGADIGFAIATDSSGNVYLTGQGGSAAVVTAYNSNGVAFGTTLANAGSNDAFIVKYNTSGTVQWVARIASTGIDVGFAIATDSSGNIYLTGQGGSGVVVTAYNSDGTAFATTLAGPGGSDAFLVKYNTSGFVQWVAQLATQGSDRGNAITTDSAGNVYVIGQGSGLVRAYNSDLTMFGSAVLPGTGMLESIFVVKYNTSGFAQWISIMDGGGTGTDQGRGIALDTSGNIYTTGSFAGTTLIPYSA